MNGLLNSSLNFCKRNASTILTCLGGAGVVGTAVLVAKETPKALSRVEEATHEKGEELTKFEAAVACAPAYIPAVLVGSATIACIFGANVLNTRQQAALMSAYALLDNSYKEYRNKVDELYGEGSDREIKNEVAKDHYEPEEEYEDGLQLFYDEYSERYFRSTKENVIKAEYELNRILAQDVGAFLNEFYEPLPLDTVSYGEYLGWSAYELTEGYGYCWVEFRHTKVVMDDGMECTIISFMQEPIFDFENY
jgi:hypothetical protein